MNCQAHKLIIWASFLLGLVSLIGCLILGFLGKQIPSVLEGLASMVVTGFFGHMSPSPKNGQENDIKGDQINVLPSNQEGKEK